MRCQDAQEHIVLAHYGELADDLRLPLERHITACEDCRREWNALQALDESMALDPVVDPSPNLLALSRMRLDEALDATPAGTLAGRLRANAARWLGLLSASPALAMLLLGVGFLGGNALMRWQVAHMPQVAGVNASLPSHAAMQPAPERGEVARISGIRQQPNSDLVQVDYSRLVPESVQGSVNSPEIRNLLLLGTRMATTPQAHEAAVSLVADTCRGGRICSPGDGGSSDSAELRLALVNSLRFDRSAAVRLQVLRGLQPYVADDVHVRDAVLEALMHDKSEAVRTQAVMMLLPVGADSSVRQALRTVSADDANPAVRNASFEMLRSASDIE